MQNSLLFWFSVINLKFLEQKTFYIIMVFNYLFYLLVA